jgi:hypothetical protein
VTQEAEHRDTARVRHERGHRISDDGSRIGTDDPTRIVELDEVATVPARVTVAQIADDVGGKANAQPERVD